MLPILNTKLYIPATHPDLVARPRLLALLDAGMRPPTKVMLISAPAGFGKTTLVSSWLHQLDARCNASIHVAWLSLDENDNAPLQCLHYVIAALQTVKPEIGKSTLAAAQSSSSVPLEMLITHLINELAVLSQQIVLVLDDYHTITTMDVHRMIHFLIEHLPPNVRLLISTREDPPLALSRLRVRQQLTELRVADLRFTEAEAAVFLNELMTLGLEPDDITALENRTEGWIAGLQLAALSLHSIADKSDFIRVFAGSHRFLTDYLVDEVLSRQTPAIQKFLRRTSILDRFCTDVCDAVLEDADSRQTLRQLEQANLFLIPLDNERRWFRYHHLFADFLRVRLYENEPDFMPDLYHRAIEWFAQNGFLREAMQYALKAQDYERAADLIEALAPEILERDNHMLVTQWADALPLTLVKQRACLCVYLGWAWSIAADMGAATMWLDTAESLCARLDPAQARIIRSHVAAHRAYILLLQGDYTQSIPFAHQALELLPADEAVLRARAIACLGNAYHYDGRLQEAKHALQQAVDVARNVESLSLATFSYCTLGQVFRDEGELAQAHDVYQQLLQFSETLTGNAEGPLTGYAYFEIGVILREQYELDRAIEQLGKGVRLCREWQQGEALGTGLLQLAETHRLRGEYAQAEAALDQVRPVAAAVSPWAMQLVNALAARLALSQGNMAAVAHWAAQSGLEETADNSVACDIGYERIADCPALIRLYLATGKAQQALKITEYLSQRERAVGRMGRLRQFLVLQAAALDALGESERALHVLAEAVENAAPHKHILPFVDHGRTLLPYLRKLPPSLHRDRLLSIMDADTPIHAPSAEALAEADLLAPLKEREIQVLKLMAAGLSNREIAKELYLSVNTVRWYASQIYSKLAVKRRGEAVSRARELGLLSQDH